MRILLSIILCCAVNCIGEESLMDIVRDLDNENAIDYSGQDISSDNNGPNGIYSSEEDETPDFNENKLIKTQEKIIKDVFKSIKPKSDYKEPKALKHENINISDENDKGDAEGDYGSAENESDGEGKISKNKSTTQIFQKNPKNRSTTETSQINPHNRSSTENLQSNPKNRSMTERSESKGKQKQMKMKQGKALTGAIIPRRIANLDMELSKSSQVPKNMSCQQKSPTSEEDLTSTTLLNYPFVVSIQKKGSHYATGALLNHKWILSVAGEFYNVRESLKLFRVRLGSVDNKRGGLLVPLKRVVIHPDFIQGEPNFDLAMLRIGKPVEYSDYIKPIAMTNFTSKVIGGKFLTAYWPRVIVKGEPLPPTASERIRQNSLRVSTQKLIPSDKCNKRMLKSNSTLGHSTLCLSAFVSHHTPCVPDAGAPIVGQDGLWGVTSGWVSKQCQRSPSPYVFSRLSSLAVRSWLDAQLSGH